MVTNCSGLRLIEGFPARYNDDDTLFTCAGSHFSNEIKKLQQYDIPKCNSRL